jgi:hypothetical protein
VRTKATLGKANHDKGNKFERDVAAYYRLHGMATAERRVITGWRASTRSSADLGDIRDVPGICTQAKNVVDSYPRGLAGKALADLMAETETQAAAAGAALWLLVEKRARHLVAESWAHMPANLFCALIFGIDPFSSQWADITWPIRVELSRIIDQLAAFSQTCSEVAA